MQKFRKIGIFLLPGQKAAEEIYSMKKYFKSFENKQNFLNDFPHLTLLHGIYGDYKNLEKNIKKNINLIKELKTNGWLIGIATNKSRIGLTNGLAKHHLSEFFDITLSTDENIPKPNPAMAIKAMKDLGVQNKFSVIIGDTINDIGLGVNGGITSIGVTWGYNSRELLTTAGATHLVNNANDLGKLMKTIFI